MKKKFLTPLAILGINLVLNSCSSNKGIDPDCKHNPNFLSTNYEVYRLDAFGEETYKLGLIFVDTDRKTFTFTNQNSYEPYPYGKTGQFISDYCLIKDLIDGTSGTKYTHVIQKTVVSPNDLDGDGNKGLDITGSQITDYGDILYYDLSYTEPDGDGLAKLTRWKKIW